MSSARTRSLAAPLPISTKSCSTLRAKVGISGASRACEEELAHRGVFAEADRAVVGLAGLRVPAEYLQQMATQCPVRLVRDDGVGRDRVERREPRVRAAGDSKVSASAISGRDQRVTSCSVRGT